MKFDHLPGLDVTLSSNGADLEEYEDENDEEPQPRNLRQTYRGSRQDRERQQDV